MSTKNKSQHDFLPELQDPLLGLANIDEFDSVDEAHSLSLFTQKDSSVSSESTVSEPQVLLAGEIEEKAQETPSFSVFPEKSFAVKLFSQLRFLAYYGVVSCVVFMILQLSTNFAAYSTLVQDYFDPKATERSGADMLQAMNNSKITIYAEEEIAQPEEKEEDIRKQLSDDRVTVREARFAPKNLLSTANKLSKSADVDFDIAPYDNRIIVPKIGKNIPLVDVLTNNFDFDHMENIFMKELEKGVVRYPGTARPGEAGNAFIFGHSSNYPWMKGEYNDVFALLDKLSYGDEIIVYYNQQKFVYVIREKRVVRPGDVRALKRDESKKELSLMTCWPVGTTLNRMLVFAELQDK